MAEVQTSNAPSGEMALRFIEFVQMHAQNVAFCLGRIPNPQTGQPSVNLGFAKLLIDQLAAVAERTKGNLSEDEDKILHNTLSSLRIAYVEVSQAQPKPAA